MRIEKTKKNRGFTLIEIMVAISIFIIVMVISSGSILSIIDANRKSQSLRSVMDNMNSALESMTREIRFGKVYHCDTSVTPITDPYDCAVTPASSIAVLNSLGIQTLFELSSGVIYKTSSGSTYPLTSSDMTITSLAFYVSGSAPYSDLSQPKVVIVVSGYSGSKPTSKTTFTLETTVSQRKIDS